MNPEPQNTSRTMQQSLSLPLPRGIICGSCVSDGDKISFARFRAACEHAARLVRGRLSNIHEAYAGGIVVNYHEATITYDFGRKTVRVLCSACYPVIAFATAGPSRDSCDLTFTDCPMLATAIGEKIDCTVLSASDANRQPVPALTDALDEDELRDIEYWRPQRVGDVVFNHWD